MLRQMLPWLTGQWLLERVLRSHPPLPLAEGVDLDRFMGDWYVIGGILTPLEWGVCNAVESYRRNPDGSIATRFSFRRGGPRGCRSSFDSTAFVSDEDPAVWGMQFVAPLRADYRIMRVDPDYRIAVVGREARDLVWIMARTPALDDATWEGLCAFLGDCGYAMERAWRVPQQWPEPETAIA